MRVTNVAKGVAYVEVPEAELYLLCGCPENVVKHLMKAGIIHRVEKGGVIYESGPNAILLSECSILGGRFANAAEFPVLQMLYRQGMIVPGHPGNTGRRPMLVGLLEQLEAQSRYIYLGNYGLSSKEELESSGLPEGLADERFRMKLRFAFGKIRDTEELLDLRAVDARAVELRDGVFVHRLGPNRYAVIYRGESVEVDLEAGLSPIAPPYELPRSIAPRSEFSVVHLGEGDGWDPTRPCIGSLIMHKGQPWLVDAGPDIEASLEAVGLGIGDLRGVFHTHVHDDHFIGLASLFRAPRRLRFCAVPWVRAAAAAKLAALAGIGESEFGRYFEVQDLTEGVWNDVDGLEVLPLFSPHPVETTIMRFRSHGRTYAHWADLTSFKVMDSFITTDPSAPGLSADLVARVKADYLEPADLKKLDVGGGMIHGEADDFASDASVDILLSHTDSPIAVQRPFGRIARFGEASVFAPSAESMAPRESLTVPGPAFEALRSSLLIGQSFPEEALARLSSAAEEGEAPIGCDLAPAFPDVLLVILSGRARLLASGEALATLGPGDVFGEERIICREACLFGARALDALRILVLPRAAIEDIPAFLWSLNELHGRRLAAARGVFRFVWRADYSVGVESLDAVHREIFDRIRGLQEAWSRDRSLDALISGLLYLEAVVKAHYEDEEARMEAAGYPAAREHRRTHELILSDARAAAEGVRRGEYDPAAFFEGMKDRLLEHSLLIDREYMPWLAARP